MSSTEDNKAISNRMAEAINAQDFDAMDQLMEPTLAERFKAQMADGFRAFPDFHDVNELQVAEGDYVANRFRATGTHRGEYMGIPATGRTVTIVGIAIDEIRDAWSTARRSSTWRGSRSSWARRCGRSRWRTPRPRGSEASAGTGRGLLTSRRLLHDPAQGPASNSGGKRPMSWVWSARLLQRVCQRMSDNGRRECDGVSTATFPLTRAAGRAAGPPARLPQGPGQTGAFSGLAV
jgi:predicted ester cyclase